MRSTALSCVGTHYVGLLRSLGFWLCRKNIGSSRRSRPWRQDSLLLWYSQPGKPKYHLRKSSGPWKKGLLECPFFPELIACRKRGHMPQESWTPSSWGLSATRWAARPDSMTFSTRHLPLWSIQLPPLSSQHGRPRQSVPHGSGNIRFPWFVQSIPSQAMHGGNLYLHGGPASLSIQALRKVTISSPPSARMAWASSPGLARLIEPFVGWKMHWGEGEFPQSSGTASASSSQTVPSNSGSPGIREDTWVTGWPNPQLMFTPERSAMWLSRYGRKWRTTSRRSAWEDEWSGKTLVILTGRACPWLSHPHQRRVWRTPYLVNLWKKTSPSSLHLKINHHLCWRKTTQARSKKYLLYRKNRIALYPARHQQINCPPHGPLRVVVCSRKSGPMGTYKIHLLTVDHKAVGCGWQPNALKAQDLNPIDHQSDPHSYQECVRCFKLYDFPSDWPVEQAAQEEDSELSSSSADSLTDDSVDTASESEKVTASDLKTSIPNDPSER